MRHGKKFNHLSRTSSHRKAMLSNMASSLILKKRIKTTVAKAKALRKYVEPLLTKAKNDSTHSRRVVFSYLQNKFSVQELFGDVATRIAERPGGYTRILKTGNRLGDNAEMCIIELVDYNENLLGSEKQAKSKTRRGRSKKKAEDNVKQEAPAAVAEPLEESETLVEEEAESPSEKIVEAETQEAAEASVEDQATEEVPEESSPEAAEEDSKAEDDGDEEKNKGN